MKDRAPRMEALPGAFVELLRLPNEKVNKPTPSMSFPESLMAEELRDRLTDAGQAEDDDDPCASLDENEYEGPSVGRAKASHPTPKEAAPAPVQQELTPPQAAVEGEPLAENDLPGTVCPKYCKNHVGKHRYLLDEDINGKVVEHVTVDGHPYELITKTSWEMDGADGLRFPQRMYDHRTKVNAVTRGQPGQDTSCFNDEMWMDLDDFFRSHAPKEDHYSHCRRAHCPVVPRRQVQV